MSNESNILNTVRLYEPHVLTGITYDIERFDDSLGSISNATIDVVVNDGSGYGGDSLSVGFNLLGLVGQPADGNEKTITLSPHQEFRMFDAIGVKVALDFGDPSIASGGGDISITLHLEKT
jgi:hypothetical protein